MAKNGKNRRNDKKDWFGPSASTGLETSDTEDFPERGSLPEVKKYGVQIKGVKPQLRKGGHIKSESLKSKVVDRLRSITIEQWLFSALFFLCLCICSEIQFLKPSRKSTDSSPSIEFIDVDKRLQSVIGDLASLKPRLESLNKSQEDNDGIKALETKLKDANEQLKQSIMLQVTSKLDELMDKQRTLKEVIGQELKDFETKTNEQMSEWVGKLEDHINKTDEMHAALDERLGTINGTSNNLTKELVSLKRNLELYTTDIRDKAEDKAEEMSVKLEKADIYTELKNFQTHMETMTKKLANHDKDLDTAFNNLFNKEAAIIVIVLILTMNIGLVFAVYVLCKGRNRTGGISAITPTPNTDGDAYYNPVLDKIPVRPVLRKAVGVISFSRQHQDLHRRLVESLKVGNLQHIDVVYHVILKNEDIITIPHCSLIIICIEYSARDVIIELEGFALGDCNKTTLKAVQILGAIPIIVYDYDHRSQKLDANKIFSEQIGCATRQEELIPLSEANRFYSVYDSFSPHQKQVLQATIQTHVLN